MNYKRALYYIWSVKFGDTEDLKRRVGNENYSAIKKRGYIVQGVVHPEVWRISEEGKQFCNALFLRSKLRRLLDSFLTWLLL